MFLFMSTQGHIVKFNATHTHPMSQSEAVITHAFNGVVYSSGGLCATMNVTRNQSKEWNCVCYKYFDGFEIKMQKILESARFV